MYTTDAVWKKQISTENQRLTSIVHILSPKTDNCPSWISGRERMTVGSNLPAERAPWEYAPTEPPRPAEHVCNTEIKYDHACK